MKKLLALVLALVLTLTAVSVFAEKLVIVGTSTPHVVILNQLVEDLKALGYELEVKDFVEWVLLNPSTSDGDLQANYFQHLPYLSDYNASVAADKQLVAVIPVHYEPLGLYPGTKTSLDDIADGDKIAVPNDATNGTRALLLLQDAGLIKLPEGSGPSTPVTVADIAENPKNLKFEELDAALIPAARPDVAYAVINGNNALLNGLNPQKDALFIEPADGEAAKTYTNYIVVRAADENAPFVEALRKVVQTQKIKDFILNNPDFAGGVIPSFEVPAE